MKDLPNRLNRGQVFWRAQMLKKAGIPFTRANIMIEQPKTDIDTSKHYVMFTCDSWAAKKAMHPFDGVNCDFVIWDSKIRGSAQVAFKLY